MQLIRGYYGKYGKSTEASCSINGLLPNHAIPGLLSHDSKKYAIFNNSEILSSKCLRWQKAKTPFQCMATVREETQHNIKQETSSNMKAAVSQTTWKIRTIGSQRLSKMIYAASDLAISIINNKNNKVLMTVPDSVESMITLLQYGNQKEKEIGACALHRLAAHTQNRSIIAQRGGIPPLLDLVQNGTSMQKNQATATIATLAVQNDNNKLLIAEAGGISPLLQLAKEGTDEQKSLAVRALYCLAKNRNIREEFFEIGDIGPILDLVAKNNTIPKLKRYATATLQLFSTNYLQ